MKTPEFIFAAFLSMLFWFVVCLCSGCVSSGLKYEFDKRARHIFQDEFPNAIIQHEAATKAERQKATEAIFEEWLAGKVWLALGGGSGLAGIAAALGIHLKGKERARLAGLVKETIKEHNGRGRA